MKIKNCGKNWFVFGVSQLDSACTCPFWLSYFIVTATLCNVLEYALVRSDIIKPKFKNKIKKSEKKKMIAINIKLPEEHSNKSKV